MHKIVIFARDCHTTKFRQQHQAVEVACEQDIAAAAEYQTRQIGKMFLREQRLQIVDIENTRKHRGMRIDAERIQCFQ